MRVAFDVHQILHFDGTVVADAAQIVASKVDASGPLVEARTRELLRGLARQVEARGVPLETYLSMTGQNPDELVARLREEATLDAKEVVTTFGHGGHRCPAQRFSLSAITRTVGRLAARYELIAQFEAIRPLPEQIGGVARAAGGDGALRHAAQEAADRHLAASLPHVTGDYMGEHWLASFALLALLG